MGTDVGTLTGTVAILKSAGVDDDAAARKLALEFSDGKGNIPYIGNAGQKKYGGKNHEYGAAEGGRNLHLRHRQGGAKSPSTIPQSQKAPPPSTSI